MPQAQPAAPTFTTAEQQGLERLRERGLIQHIPSPQHIEIPVFPSLVGANATELLDEVRGAD